MAAKKGQPKVAGRTKGTPNKRTQESIERVEWVLSLLEPTLESDIAAITEIERVRLWNDLQEYVRPKLARTQVEHSGGIEVKQITGMEVK
jgi:hypothetical protein